VTVTNVGQVPAQVGVRDAPRWLLVKPETFRLSPGAKQAVELVGRVDKARGRKHRVAVTFAVEGGQEHRVEVVLRVKLGGPFGV
jgi:hypothetical protein